MVGSPSSSSGQAPWWAGLAPGAELAVALEGLDLPAVDDSPLVDVMVCAERPIAHLRALQLRAMDQLTRREHYAFCGGCEDADPGSLRHTHSPVRAAGSEVSAALAWTPGHADARVALAVELAEDLPATLNALDAGAIDERRAELIASKTRVLGWAARRQVEEQVLPTAGERTIRQLGNDLDRWVLKADPAAAEKRREQGKKDRRVERPRPYGDGDGIGVMSLVGPAEDLVAFWTAVDAAARAARAGGDQRTLDQLRFDIATGLGWTALASGHLGCCTPDCPGTAHRTGTAHGRAATVNVTMPFPTLAGVDDEPALLEGFGWVSARVGRAVAADATLRRLLTDPVDGQLLEYGRTTYPPPQALADFVIARDRTCRFPTSDTPARACDLDHRVPYEQGGTTGEQNLEALGRRFHVDKSLHGWRLERLARGVFVWTSPAGRIYRVGPEPIGIVAEPDPPPDTEADPPPDTEPEPPPF